MSGKSASKVVRPKQLAATLKDYFIDTYNYYKGLSKEVEVMFKSFYDPEVEKRGIVKGFEKGMQQGQDKAKEEIARNMISKGMTLEFVAETTELSLERVKEIAKENMS